MWIATFASIFLAIESLLYLRIMPDKIMTYWFALTIVCGFLWWWAVAAPAYALHQVGILSKYALEKWSIQTSVLMVRTVRFINPQLRVKREYSRLKWSQVSQKAHVLCNHMCFWDSINYSCEVPVTLCYWKRTLMKSSLANLPIAGWLFFKCMGQFPVYFNSEKTEEFKVDVEKQAKVAKDIDNFLASGGGLTYCPEGKMNPNPSQVQPLRYGTLKVIAASKHPVVIMTMWNNEKFWPLGADFGGHAADIYCTIAEYKYGGGDGETPLPINKSTGELDVDLYAKDMQAFMQKEVDRLKASVSSAK